MLRSRALARMREQAESLMTETATIARPGAASVDTSGNWVEGSASTSSSACRLIMARNSRVTALIGEQDSTREYYELILPYNADVQSGDRVTVNSVRYELLRFVERHTDSVSLSVLVTPLALQSDALEARFTSSADKLEVTFTDTSLGTPTSWAWDFGDDNTSTSQNPTHTYASSGTYTVTLTATNGYGSDIYTAEVTVSDALVLGDVIYAENVGGAVFANSLGGSWSADGTYGSGGSTIDLSATSIDVSDDSLDSSRTYEYMVLAQQHKYGEISYTFPTSNGQAVRIYIYTYEPFWSSTGQRVFDVAVDTVVPGAFNDIDPYALASAQYKVVVITYDYTCTGSLTVALQNVTDNALICGIEIRERV